MKQILLEWRNYVGLIKEQTEYETLEPIINKVLGGTDPNFEELSRLINFVKKQETEKTDLLGAGRVADSLVAHYMKKERQGVVGSDLSKRIYQRKSRELKGLSNVYRGGGIGTLGRATDAFLGLTNDPVVERGLYDSRERPAFAKFIDDLASSFKAETGLNILDPSRPFIVPSWARKSPATYAALQTLADLAASDPFTVLQNAAVIGSVERYAANSLMKKEIAEGLKQVSKKVAAGQVTERTIQSEIQSVINKAKNVFTQTIESSRGGLSPKQRAYWAERYNANRATQLKAVDKIASPEKAKKVADVFRQHLENSRNLVNLSDQNFIKSALNFATEEGNKLKNVIFQHVQYNYTFPKDLADKLFRIAKTGKNNLVQLYKGSAFKGISIDFAEQLVGEAAIPKAPGVHRVKLKTPIYLDPEQNIVRSYRSKYNYEVKSPVSEWTSDFKVAEEYSLRPMSSEARKTLTSRGNQETIAILEAQAVPGQNNFLNYELLKDKAGFGKEGVVDLYQGELLSYGKVRVDYITIINN